ncbi:hypothetical protein [Myroides odoratus]|uniref:Uncharacterized protein n=1 Tax=Myroides odoratus TaxID=256 RepID=A0A378RJT0_MYROD|nr:hypothetical protein [Myroides odoratus]QQU05195.1 hypothetical protein I6I89_07925 [Myroides odoratus]STZ27313.1 Uncharacterised protein [Myroides odoratus]
MKKLMVGLAVVFSFGVFANNGEIIKADKVDQFVAMNCYLLQFEAIYYQNYQAVNASKQKHEKNYFGTYDNAVIALANFQDSFSYYPRLEWSVGTGWMVFAYEPLKVSNSQCFSISQ